MDINPLMSEWANVSPGLKTALSTAGMAPPANPAAITPQMKSAASPTPDTPPSLSPMKMPGADAVPTLGSPPSPNINVAPPVRGTLAGDQAERSRLLSTGSGESQIAHRIENSSFGQNHHILGNILGVGAQGLATLGDIGLSALAPGIAAAVPGTEYHHGELLHSADKQVAADETNAKDEAQTANLGATTAHTTEENAEMPQKAADAHAESEANTGNVTSETNLRDHPVPNLAQGHAYAVQKAINEGRDPATDPLVQHYEKAIQSTVPGFNKPVVAPKTTDIQMPDGVHTMGFDDKTGKFDVDEGKSGFKPATVNVNAGEAALDRESKQFGAPHQKAVTDANTQLEKIADARNMINGNAESQALGVPKVLTALVSGQGSGVRITQPELNAIAKARGLVGDVEGTLNSLAGKGKLTSEQQKQLTGILDDVKNRILQKQQIASDALDSINGATTREQIIQADKQARQKLGDMERAQSGQVIVKAPNGKSYPFPNQAAADKFKQEAGIK